MDLRMLSKSFEPEDIDWRIGRVDDKNADETQATVLAYIDVRALYERLDDAVGQANWQLTYPIANGKTCCELSIKTANEWVTKANGAGDTQVEGDKGAFSDSAKRAGVPWGVGRYLYDMPEIKVKVKKWGNYHYIDNSFQQNLASLAMVMGALNDAETVDELSAAKDKARSILGILTPKGKHEITRYIKRLDKKIKPELKEAAE